MYLDLLNNGKRVDRMSTISGTYNRQKEMFVHPSKDWAGSGRPIHEGVFSIGRVDRSGSNDPGVGPIWIPVQIQPKYKSNNRGAFGFHDDVNRNTARGSLGCIVTYSRVNLEYIIQWLEARAKPTRLIVDLGTGFLEEKGFKIMEDDTNDQLTPIVEPSRISGTGLKLVKHFEGMHRLKPDGMVHAYLDPVGIWTIGYGHTRGVYAGQKISKEMAEAILAEDMNEFETGVRRLVDIALNQHEFDALVSFSFNVGLGAFKGSTLRRKLNNNDLGGAAAEFGRWKYGTINGQKVELPGLVRRRKSEEHLFLTGRLDYFA